MNHFCTITTADHAYKVFALFDSLLHYNREVCLHVLVTDSFFPESNSPQLKVYFLDEVRKGEPVADQIIKKYSHDRDKLRWSMKPAFLKYLLTKNETTKLIYLDNDIFFFNDYDFLFDYLNQHSFALTPHNYERSPDHSQNMLEANYRVGLYNAGFVGVNKNAINTLQWWAECCLYKCEKNPFRGTFDDQKYLDLVPVMCEDALIVRHQGCNVAEWNRYVCLRENIDGEILINGKYPIVFIHFNYTTIREILNGNDLLLNGFFNQYMAALTKYFPEITKAWLYRKPTKLDSIKFFLWQLVTPKNN
jgi:lipopolysaccharide biosynthesis glycosyltransferase